MRRRRFSRRQHHRDLRRGHLCYGPRQQLRHRLCAEPRWASQRALSVHLRYVYSLRYYGEPAGVAAESVTIRSQGHGAVPAGPRRVRGANPHGTVADRSAAGHTGLPFLAALAFWHIPQWRVFYLALTAFFGSIVLLGHYHYSIDVLAALFITHGVFQVSCWLFARDYALFRSSENPAVPRQKRANRNVGGPARALDPFTLHVVGKDDPGANDQQKTVVMND